MSAPIGSLLRDPSISERALTETLTLHAPSVLLRKSPTPGRMPVASHRNMEEMWLDNSVDYASAFGNMLTPYSPEAM